MRIVKKNVYYCDHCKKRSLSAGSMNKHEKHCTANPNRECGLHIFTDGGSPDFSEILNKFKDRFEIVHKDIGDDVAIFSSEIKWIGEPVTVQEIRDATDNCPACILSVIRQCKFNDYLFEEFRSEFDYKKEVGEIFSDHNNREAKRAESNYYG